MKEAAAPKQSNTPLPQSDICLKANAALLLYHAPQFLSNNADLFYAGSCVCPL